MDQYFVLEHFEWLSSKTPSIQFAVFVGQLVFLLNINLFFIFTQDNCELFLRSQVSQCSSEHSSLTFAFNIVDDKVFTATKLAFPHSPVSSFQLSISTHLVFEKFSTIRLELTFFPVISSLSVSFPLKKIAYILIAINQYFFPSTCGKVIKPLTLVTVRAVNKFSITVSLVSLDCSQVIGLWGDSKETFRSSCDTFFEVPLEILPISGHYLSEAMRNSLLPLATIVQLISFDKKQRVDLNTSSCFVPRRFQNFQFQLSCTLFFKHTTKMVQIVGQLLGVQDFNCIAAVGLVFIILVQVFVQVGGVGVEEVTGVAHVIQKQKMGQSASNLLINLVMILLRTRLVRWFHFVRPSLSSLTSLRDLETIMHERLLNSLKDINNSTLNHYSLVGEIQTKLALQSKEASHASQHTVPVSLVNPSTLEHTTVDFRLDKDLKSLNLHPQEFDFPFASEQTTLTHFSKKRGIPVFEELKEYYLNERTLLIFNLPDNITEQDIQVMLKEKTEKVTFKYCVLGLPAYAWVKFEDQASLERAKSRIKNKTIDFGQRSAKVKGPEDLQKLRLANRRLVIHIEPEADLSKTIVELSRFGRVMHVDWPLQASVNPSLKQVKQFYKNSTQLIRINKHNSDGTVQSEYYPNVQVWRVDEDEREESNILDRAEKLKESYENRCRFAKPIDVFVGKQNQLSLKNRGYCVVTFSTPEECQNYYFTYGARTKMEPVGQKFDFQFDPLFKKELLRVIDNEYLLGVKNSFTVSQKEKAKYIEMTGSERNQYKQNKYQLNQGRNFQSYFLLDRIRHKLYLEEGTSKISDYIHHKEFNRENQFMEWEDRQRYLKQVKTNSQAKTFDQLAEMELYGRVLPKDGKTEKIKLQNTKYTVPRETELIEEHNLITEPKDILNRNKLYKRIRERNNRLADEALGIRSYEETHQGEEVEEEVEGKSHDGENIGKHHFSTYRPPNLYRALTIEETALYEKRFNDFLRNTIYEYMGVFHDHLIEEAVTGQLSSLNPQSLKFINGTPFLTEEEVPNILQFRRDFPQAQSDYENYVYGSEYIKSSGIDVKSFFSNYSDYEASVLTHLADVGMIESTKKVSGDEETIKEKVKVLNNEVAEFGEEYKQEIFEDEQYLVKIRKLEHLLPLDRVAHLESVAQTFDDHITVEQAKIFQKHYREMKQTGKIPEEVRVAFNIDSEITVKQLMTTMGLTYDIGEKDLNMLQRIKNYSKEEIKEDIKKQQRIERYRRRNRKIGSYDFPKDPSQIYVKDREGYYKVSRYRQI